jgi:hypothetical protein
MALPYIVLKAFIDPIAVALAVPTVLGCVFAPESPR